MLITLVFGTPCSFCLTKEMMVHSWSVISYYPLRDRWSADPGLSQAAGHSQAAQARPVRRAERVSGLWSEAGSHVKMILARGRAGPGYAGDVWTVRPGWRQVRASAGLTARRWLAEPTPPWLPGHTQAHLSGRAVPHSVLTLCSTLPAQRCTFSPPKRTVLCYYASESYSHSYPMPLSVIVGEREEQWISEWLNILIIVLR